MAPNAALDACLRPASPKEALERWPLRTSSAPVTLSFRRANHQPDDKAFVVPNLQVEAVLHLHRCGHNLFIVGTFHYFGWPCEMTVFAHCVTAP